MWSRSQLQANARLLASVILLIAFLGASVWAFQVIGPPHQVRVTGPSQDATGRLTAPVP
jgi:hypothetical protein